jgi:hypothetical protein
MLTSEVEIIAGSTLAAPFRAQGAHGAQTVDNAVGAPTTSAMPDHVQIRIISLLEEAANSFEQLETLANRFLKDIPADKVDVTELRSIERDFVSPENEQGSEMDHVVFIRFRTDKAEE